jgi:hypothetical protein
MKTREIKIIFALDFLLDATATAKHKPFAPWWKFRDEIRARK